MGILVAFKGNKFNKMSKKRTHKEKNVNREFRKLIRNSINSLY